MAQARCGDDNGVASEAVSRVPKTPTTFLSLSVELQLDIFRRCIDSSSLELGLPIVTWPAYTAALRWSCTPPVSLSHVCGVWRSLALSEPTLWDYIRVFVDEEREVLSPHSCLLQLFLERSAKRPLHIHFTQTGQPRVSTASNALPIFRLLERECARWEVVELHLSAFPQRAVDNALMRSQGLKHAVCVPLQSDYSAAMVGGDFDPEDSLGESLSLPNLVGIHYSSTIDRHYRWWLSSFASHSLRYLHLRIPLTTHDALRLLSNAPNVIAILLNLVSDDHDDPSHLILPSVRSISLYSDHISTQGISVFLDLVTIPGLSEVDFRVTNDDEMNRDYATISTSFLHMIKRSKCQAKISALSFYDLAFPSAREEALVLVLQQLPKLRELTVCMSLEKPCMTVSVLKALTLGLGEGLCEDLVSLGLYQHAVEGEGAGLALSAMMMSRFGSGLKYVYVSGASRELEEIGRDLVSGGLDFQFQLIPY